MRLGGRATVPMRERMSVRTVALAVVFGAIVGLPIAALSLAARAGGQHATELREAADPVEAAPVWRAVATRHAGFDVDAPRWRPLGQRMTVLRRSDGLSREHFQFGEASDGRRHAAVVVDRGELDPASAADELSALFSDLGLTARVSANPLPLETKFGAAATADVMLAGDDGAKACLAFLVRAPDAGLRIAAWTCNAGPEIVSRAEATCFADRIFAVGLRDPAVASIFARAELRRQEACSGTPTAAAPAGMTERGGRPALRTNRL